MKKLFSIIAVYLFMGIVIGMTGCTTSIASFGESFVDDDRKVHLYPSNDARLQNNMGINYFEQGRRNEAVKKFKEALRIKPNFAEAHSNLGIAYRELGRYEEAIAELNEALRINPNLFGIHTNLGKAYSDLGRYQEAIPYLKEAIRIKPDNYEAHANLGFAHEKLGQFKKAVASYKEAVRLKPDDFWAKLALGSVYLAQGKLNSALANLKKADRIKPNDSEILGLLGIIYWELDKPRKTVEVLKQALRNNSERSDLASANYTNLSEAYEKLKRYDEAIEAAKKALEFDYDDPWANFILGLSYDGKSDGMNAISHMIIAAKSFHESQEIIKNQDRWGKRNDQKYRAKSQKKLREFYSKYEYSPEDFGDAEIASAPSVALPANPELPETQYVVSRGTGFLFSSRDYIITNYHVVKGASSIEVKFPGGEIIKASVQAKDSQNDIAVLKLAKSPSTQIPDLKFGNSSKARPGDKVFTIGYPASSILGENQKITDGIISSVTGVEDDPTMFQITVPIQPGNSGGPLFNERGEVIGITTASLSLNAIQSLGAVPQNVNYAIKSSFVNNLLTTIPKALLSNRGIVVVPNNPGNSLSDFFERVSNNIVLIETN